MPSIKGIPGPYRFFLYSFDRNEPAHIHSRRERATCTRWLDPVDLADNHGLTPRNLTAVRRIILEDRERIMDVWREHGGAAE